MSLPTPVKTWQYNVNSPGYTSVANALYAIKAGLIGFALHAWTVVSSSDSSTAGASDKWLSGTNVVFNTNVTARSWIVLQQSQVVSGFQICIDCLKNAGNGLDIANIFISPSSGFTGGSTTARPTAADEINANWSANGSQIAGDATLIAANPARVHLWLSSDGQCTRVVVINNAVVNCFLAIDIPQNPATGWSNPWVVIYAVKAYNIALSSPGSPTYALLNDISTRSFSKYSSTAFNFFLTSEASNTSMIGEQQTFTSEVDVGGWPIFGPAGIYSTTVSAKGRHGTLFDLWWGSTAKGNGDHYPLAGSRQFVQVGHLVLPWHGGIGMLVY